MAKSIDDALTEARMILNDSTAPFRYTDVLLIRILNTALREVYALRPDAFVGNFTSGTLSVTEVPDFTTDDLEQNPETPFPVDDRLFFSPVTMYIAGKADLSDDEFAADGRAAALLTAFRNNLTGK